MTTLIRLFKIEFERGKTGKEPKLVILGGGGKLEKKHLFRRKISISQVDLHKLNMLDNILEIFLIHEKKVNLSTLCFQEL